jgi:hypothetical protein
MDKVKELASDNVLLSAHLLLEDARELKANLAMELDLARDRRLAQEKEFREFMAELRDTLTKIQAQFKVEAQLLNLVGGETKRTKHAREQRQEKRNTGRDSSRASIEAAFVSHCRR